MTEIKSFEELEKAIVKLKGDRTDVKGVLVFLTDVLDLINSLKAGLKKIGENSITHLENIEFKKGINSTIIRAQITELKLFLNRILEGEGVEKARE